MNIIKGYETWSELELLAGVIIGEARGETTAGMIGVGVTVRTRVQHPCWWGRNWREVILRDGREDNPHDAQFSCWQDANAAVIRESRQKQTPLWKMMMGLAIDIYTGKTADAIGGPTHYHTPLVFPDWAAKMKRLCTLGNHIFYRDIGQEGEYRA